jgi:SAM-dependent methyltransferase
VKNKELSLKNLKKHYQSLFLKYKYSYKTAQQSSRATQKKRIKILTDDFTFSKNDKILDFGCGTAFLFEYLKKEKNFKGYYTGVDMVKEIIESNKKKYSKNKKVKFLDIDILKENKKILESDYIFISGTFNNNISSNWKFMTRSLKKLFNSTKKVIAFNNLSTYVDYKDKGLYYTSPEKVFKFCKNHLSKYVLLKHNYLIKKKSIPFEFTTFVYKK